MDFLQNASVIVPRMVDRIAHSINLEDESSVMAMFGRIARSAMSNRKPRIARESVILGTELFSRLRRSAWRIPEVSFVVEQLLAMCQHIGEAVPTNEKLSLLLPVYTFLAKKIRAGKSEDKVYIATLLHEKCVLGEAGRIDFPYHVSAAQLVDKPPRYCIHPQLRRESLKVLWREIGVHQLDDLKELSTPFRATTLATILMDDFAERNLWLACCTENVKVHTLLWVLAGPLSKSLIRPHPDEHARYELKLPHDGKFEKYVVDIIVRYVYTGRVSDENLTVHQAIFALELAGALNIEYVTEYLSQFLEGTPVADEE